MRRFLLVYYLPMKTINVISWNIFAGKDIPGVIRLLKKENPDFIALQEILAEKDGSNNQAAVIAEALGYTYIFASAHMLNPGGSYVLDYFGIERDMQWGNALVSRLPFKSSRTHRLSENLGRIMIEGCVDVEGEVLNLFSTHLVGGDEERHDAVRLEQARSLVALIPKNRSIIMGDFNAPPESPVISVLKDVVENTDPTPPFVSTRKGQKIDYIFTTADIHTRSHDTFASQASDHLPVGAELSF